MGWSSRLENAIARFEGGLFLLFFFWLPFGTRTTLHSFGERLFPYETLFVYATDLLLLALGSVGLWSWYKERKTRNGQGAKDRMSFMTQGALAVFLAVALIASLRNPADGLSVVTWIRLLLFVVFAVFVARRLVRVWSLCFLAVFASGVSAT